MTPLTITRGKNEGDTVKIWQGVPTRTECGHDVHFYANETSTCIFNVVDQKAFSKLFGIAIPPVDSQFPLNFRPRQ